MQRPDLDHFLNLINLGKADKISADDIEALVLYIQHLEYLEEECNRRF